MPELSQKTTVEILGEQYTIKSDISPQEVHRLAEFVNAKIEGIRHKAKSMPLLTVAILACLNIAEELFKVRRQLEETQNLMEEESANILKLLDESFHL
ncbi:MAG: cell division protein ZapA [bacterium]|nr:cell division protein ZapA [bacterium]